MNVARHLPALFLLLAFACSDSESPDPPDDCLTVSASSNGKAVEDRYIVSIDSENENNTGRMSLQAAALLKRHNLSRERVLNSFKGKYSNYVLSINSEEANALSEDPEVVHVEREKVVSLCACFTVIEPRLVTWNVEKVGYGDGTGKTAWILDTGVDYTHTDLTVDTLRSRSFVSEKNSARDDNGHGTHVAGIIGAKNNRVGTLGVASGATIVGLKVLDSDGNGLLSDVLDALSYVRKYAKAGEVVNISLGVDEMSAILDEEVQALAESGIYVVIAAGNEGRAASNYSPGRTNGKNIYTVSAVDSLDRFATFSNFGNDAIDYAAPGVRILSTYMFGKYAIMSGTSQATPHVSGLLLVNGGKVNSMGNALSDPDGTADPIAHK